MFHQDEYFKSHDCKIDNAVKKSIEDLCSLVSDQFNQFNIDKFTIVLGKNEPINIAISNDKNRTFELLKTINTELGVASLTNTTIKEVTYSDIPMVFIDGNSEFDSLVSYLKQVADSFLPPGYCVGNHPGSIYVVFNKNFTGQLWNIHTDPFPTKSHLILTDCNEEFIWYKKGWSMATRLLPDKFYMFNVQVHHTVKIVNYIDNRPRVHVIFDVVRID